MQTQLVLSSSLNMVQKPAEIVTELLTASVNPLLLASMDPEPAVVVTDRSFHVATPETATLLRELPEARAPQVAEPFLLNTTVAELSVQTVLEAFSTDTETVPSEAPSRALDGWAVKMTFDAPQGIA